MMNHLKQWWAAHVTWVAAVVAFLDPSVQAFVAHHPNYAITIGALWGFLLNVLPSPVAKPPVQ